LPTIKPFYIADTELEVALQIRFLIGSSSFSSPSSSIETRPNLVSSSSSNFSAPRQVLVCLACTNPISTSLNHEDTCRAASRGWIIRHNKIRDSLASILGTKEGVKATIEPNISGSSLRPDFSLLAKGRIYYYDVKIVAVNANSAELDPIRSLESAARDKELKYRELGPSFRPLIFSSGGLMAKGASSLYKKLQKSLGRASSKWLDSTLSLALLRARYTSRLSLISSLGTTH